MRLILILMMNAFSAFLVHIHGFRFDLTYGYASELEQRLGRISSVSGETPAATPTALCLATVPATYAEPHEAQLPYIDSEACAY